MAIINPSTPFDSVRRKFAKSDNIHFCCRKSDNATIGVRVKHPYDGGSSAAQQAVRNKFRQAKTAAAAALADPEQRAALLAAFKRQKRYLTLTGYAFAVEYAKIGA
jgi:hypothetical protein